MTGITAEDRTYTPGDASATLDTTGAQLVGVVAGDGPARHAGHQRRDRVVLERCARGDDRHGRRSPGSRCRWRPGRGLRAHPADDDGDHRPGRPGRSRSPRPPRAPRRWATRAYDVAATATSGLTVSFAIDPGSTGVCELRGQRGVDGRGHLHDRSPARPATRTGWPRPTRRSRSASPPTDVRPADHRLRPARRCGVR